MRDVGELLSRFVATGWQAVRSDGIARYMALVWGAVACFGAGVDVSLPLEGGRLFVQDVEVRAGGTLAFAVVNQTPAPWTRLALRFDIKAQCGGETRTASQVERFALGWRKEAAYRREYRVLLREEGRNWEGCNFDPPQVSLVSAEGETMRIDGLTGERTVRGPVVPVEAKALVPVEEPAPAPVVTSIEMVPVPLKAQSARVTHPPMSKAVRHRASQGKRKSRASRKKAARSST